MSSGVGHDLSRAQDLARERGLGGATVALLAETTSTNDEAKRAARSGAATSGLSVFLAETQTAGRGRQGRSWSSPHGENLLFSVLFRLAAPPQNLPLVALAAGLAVRDAVARAVPSQTARRQWPNDVLVSGRKVAGILVESVVGSAASAATPAVVVVGVGINVHTRRFPDELATRATSLSLECDPNGPPPDRAAVLVDVLVGLDRDVPLVAARGLGLIHARLSAADALRGHEVQTDDGRMGVAEGIDLDGRLAVRGADGVLRRLAAGEVHLVSSQPT
jgi:BirA family biotin operon repressor/biotin-[acetyl-CoA-carboxylase] ligase